MFERLTVPDLDNSFTFFFEGKPVPACDGDTVAAALIAVGIIEFRTSPVSGQLRGPFCLMGSCFECLVEIDGQTVQACMTPARSGIEIRQPRVPEGTKGGTGEAI